MIYRGSGDWGPGKGSNLTPEEVDQNFWEIEQRLAALEAYSGAADAITNVTISGSLLTIYTTSNPDGFPVVLAIPRIAGSETVAVSSYEAVLSDALKMLVFTNAGGCSFNIPADADVEFPDDTEIHVLQYAAGQVAIVSDSAVTISAPASFDLLTAEQGSVVTLKKIGPDEWIAFGDLALVSA